jgi:hypothetical protein
VAISSASLVKVTLHLRHQIVSVSKPAPSPVKTMPLVSQIRPQRSVHVCLTLARKRCSPSLSPRFYCAERQVRFCLTAYLTLTTIIAMKKNPHAVALGKLGGKALASKISPEQRKEWSRRGGQTRAKRHSKAEISQWGKMGGRPKRRPRKSGKPN